MKNSTKNKISQNQKLTSNTTLYKSILVVLVVSSSIFLSNCKKYKCELDPISHDKVVDLESEINLIENNLIVKNNINTRCNIQQRMKNYKVPGVSISVVEDGKIKWSKGYGVVNKKTDIVVNTNTLFQAASISKPMAALAALKLFEDGYVDLDTDVNTYLIGWKVPENNFTKNEKVTLRRLLSHTAGTTVHGFKGYKQNKQLPTIEQILSGEGNSPAIDVDFIPGSSFRYSGSGYTIVEKVVEDVSGLPFEEYYYNAIIAPLSMNNSTFTQPLPSQLHNMASAGHNQIGGVISGLWHNYPEQAAAGLWTTPSDLAKYCIEIHQIFNGKTNGILSNETLEIMLTKQSNDYGLGPNLFGTNQNETVFSHDGGNAGFITRFIAFANSGNAIVILTNGDAGLELVDEITRGMEDFYGWKLTK